MLTGIGYDIAPAFRGGGVMQLHHPQAVNNVAGSAVEPRLKQRKRSVRVKIGFSVGAIGSSCEVGFRNSKSTIANDDVLV